MPPTANIVKLGNAAVATTMARANATLAETYSAIVPGHRVAENHSEFDKAPTVGLEPTTTKLRALRSTD